MNENKEKELLTTEQLAIKFNKCESTIRNYRREGMPAVTNAPIMYYYEDCLEWLKQRKRKVRK